MAKLIETGKLINALCEAGVVEEDPNYVRRVVIDIEVGRAAFVYIQKFADGDNIRVAIESGLTVTQEDPQLEVDVFPQKRWDAGERPR